MMKQAETILKELKQLDYELFIRTQKSHLSEAQWDWLIENFKEASIKNPGYILSKEEIKKAMEGYGMAIDDPYSERIMGHCRDCKYFEYDSVAKVDGIPLIVAHEICSKWGDGCKTMEDGYCFLFKPKVESEE